MTNGTTEDHDDDFYDQLGVDPEATRDEIRDAYQAKRSELDAAEGPDVKAQKAQLNRVWNVLSDPVQRERYDDEHYEWVEEEGAVIDLEAEADLDADDDAAENGNGALAKPARPVRTPRGGAAKDPKATDGKRQPRQPVVQITDVAGVPLATNRQRSFGLGIDFLIVAVLVVVANSFVAPALSKSQKPEVVDRVEVLQDDLDDAKSAHDETKDDVDAAEKQVDDAKTGTSDEKATAKENLDQAEKAEDDAQQKVDDAEENVLDEQRKLTPYWQFSVGAALILGFAFVAIPSGLTGRSLGKRIQGTRLIGDDGQRASWRAVLIHYGFPIGLAGVTFLAIPAIGQLVIVAMVFGVTTFARNPNRQGWHDRLAHTYVAAE